MSEVATDMQSEPAGEPLEGGGPGAAAVADPIEHAIAHLELLSDEAREAVLAKMDPALAERLRNRLDTMPDRPNGAFSRDVVARRKMIREMSERIHAENAAQASEAAEQTVIQAARPAPMSPMAPPVSVTPAGSASGDPLDSLSALHPAAIARAMQGERAEAWAVVLDHLSIDARAALQMYLEPAARAAIDDARERQQELARSAPQLAQTIEAAIARTVVPRAMREHHHLLSTTPLSWSGA